MKRLTLLLFTGALVACSRPNLAGLYVTQGNTQADAAKFQMALELQADGRAQFVTRSNLGNPAMDQKVTKVMSIPSGQWTLQQDELVITGPRADDGKIATHHFAIDKNGDLIWKDNGARFHKQR